jgi:hypothetical protein
MLIIEGILYMQRFMKSFDRRLEEHGYFLFVKDHSLGSRCSMTVMSSAVAYRCRR